MELGQVETVLAYYIYYRVLPGHIHLLRQRVREMQDDIEHACGVRGRLLHKRDVPYLWMEVYEAVADAQRFESALAAALERHNVSQGLAPGSTRRTECFLS